MLDTNVHQALLKGLAIPETPLALDAARRLDERRQRAMLRYHHAAGAGGLAVACQTAQFNIRSPKVGLFKPLLEIAGEEMDVFDAKRPGGSTPLVRISGVVGPTQQATREAAAARDLGYHAGLLSLVDEMSHAGIAHLINEAEQSDAGIDDLIDHCRAVAQVIPVIVSCPRPMLPYAFWRRLADIPNVVGVQIASLNRYQTIDVVRAVAESDRGQEIALYSGNGDNIVLDLLTPYEFNVDGILIERRMVGGLLGHWAVWTKKAAELFAECCAATKAYAIPADLLRRNVQVGDAHAALCDAANTFAGGIAGLHAGLHEVLRRQGLLEGVWLLDENEGLRPGQAAEIDRVYRAYPHLNDDAFVAERLDEWLR